MNQSTIRCSCGIIHRAKDWRNAWRHAIADCRVVSIRDESGSEIEKRSYPTRAMLWNFVANLPAGLTAHVVAVR